MALTSSSLLRISKLEFKDANVTSVPSFNAYILYQYRITTYNCLNTFRGNSACFILYDDQYQETDAWCPFLTLQKSWMAVNVLFGKA